MLSPELETLDQLVCGGMPLTIIRRLYPDDGTFMRGVLGLLRNGDVRLLSSEQTEVQQWRWRELFIEGTVIAALGTLWLDITDQGAKRIA